MPHLYAVRTGLGVISRPSSGVNLVISSISRQGGDRRVVSPSTINVVFVSLIPGFYSDR
jgi:hypothetical protein